MNCWTCFVNFFCSVLAAIGGHLSRHAEAYGSVSIAVGLSVVKNIPELVPKSIQDWWTWMRNSFQTALPISRGSASPLPSPPVEPANKSK